MKLQAGWVQDVADITRMLGQAREEMLAAVRRRFTAILPTEMADLESIIALGQLEMQPPRSTKGGSEGCIVLATTCASTIVPPPTNPA